LRQLATRNSQLATRAASDLAVIFGGRWGQMLLALVGNVISARVLGPADFGRFGLVMAAITICGTLADAGLTYTTIKLIAQYHERDTSRALAVGRVYLRLRLITGSAVALSGILVSAPIAALLGYPDLTPYLQLAFFTLFSLSLSSYPGTVLVALRLFGRLGVAGILNATITLAGILLLLLTNQLNLQTLIAWNVILPLISTLPAWLLLPPEWQPWRQQRFSRWSSVVGRRSSVVGPSQPEVTREIWAFSKWMAIANLGSIIAAQGDLLLLGRLSTPAVVGVYSVALTLAMRLDVLNQSLHTVMLPRASRLEGPAQIRRYSGRVLRGSLLLALGLALVALLAQPLIIFFYGERYTDSAGLFLALLAVVLLDLVTSSLFLVAFPLNRPRVLALADWLRVGVLGAAGWLLIPLYSGLGAAAARFLSRLAGAIYTLLALRRAVYPSEDEPDSDIMAHSSELGLPT
jgi:O-antigen/teichoic acid export membrane protein